MFKSNRGQLSIFLGITLVLVMGMLAFIINIGLFVKAKINLQNSVDAAAFSGAAVQARQLTNIAYLNWEMRNNYKEWLFKYYVLGELGSLKTVAPPHARYPLELSTPPTASGSTDFTLQSIGSVSVPGSPTNLCLGCIGTTAAYDKFNLGSICIHNSGTTDICPQFVIPGLPRFPAIGVAGISEIHETFVTSLVEAKSKNCSVRSKDNFNAALTWAYGDGNKNVPPGIPAIFAADRAGAWPKAVELGMRMRNLEMIVNLPPHDGAITIHNYQGLQTSADNGPSGFSLHERQYKAFMSAFRNLGGGRNKDDHNEELVNEFKLYELAPNVYNVDRNTLSGFLIPHNSLGDIALQKHYLDLQAIPLNLATMFSTFTTTTNVVDAAANIVSEGTCGISKTAMPVPGFILGFVKNPEVMTYYAVKGESKFIGLFSPFRGTNNETGVPLVAYAAAKPFGGRIGPRLFDIDPTNKEIRVRNDTDTGNRSLSHISGLQVPLKNPSDPFNPGEPIPVSSDFWIHTGVGGSATLGGVPASVSAKIFFGIPNMIYDYENISQQSAAGTAATGQVVDIKARTGTTPVTEKVGLYDPKQYNLLKKSLDPAIVTMLNSTATATYTNAMILNSIVKARRPTRYDAVNYLVPDYKHISSDPTNAPPYITEGRFPLPANLDPSKMLKYTIFAPLLGDGLLFKNQDDLKDVINTYIASMSNAVESYEKALLIVANSIYNLSQVQSDVTGNDSRKAAARGIHMKAGGNIATDFAPALLDDSHCVDDIASKFHYFFQTTQAGIRCKVEPLAEMMVKFINNIATGDPVSAMYLVTEYYIGSSDAISQESLFTGYNPGPRQGVSGGIISSSITGGSRSGSMRNYYSTKFFRAAQVTEGTAEATGSLETSLREKMAGVPTDLELIKPKNLLKKAELTPDTFFSYF